MADTDAVALQRLLAEQACRDLVARAAMLTDANRHEDFAALFAPDGELTRPGGEPLRGREAIVASYRTRPAGRLTRHLLGGTVVELLDADRARARTSVLLWSAEEADPAGAFGRPARRQVLGEFEDEFVRGPQGWRIARRQARFLMEARAPQPR